MAKFRTCVGCKLADADCPARRDLVEAIRPFGVTSIKWRCASRVPIYPIGAPCLALTFAGDSYGEWTAPDEYQEPPRYWYPGVIVHQAVPTKFIVFIAKGTGPVECDEPNKYPFEPRNRGFCKIPMSRLRPREGDRVAVCSLCWEVGGHHGAACRIEE